MRSISLAVLTLLCISAVQAQTMPAIEWHGMFGGSDNDEARSIAQAQANNGWVLVGGSQSVDGIAMDNHGLTDALAMELGPTGQIQWHQLYGGTAADGAVDVTDCMTGGYAIVGVTNSADGNASGPGLGLEDVWVLNVGVGGEVLWQRKFGGPLNDEATAIEQTSDGGFLFTASINSTASGGDIAPGLGGYWLVKLDSTGQILWQNRFGGTNMDIPYSMSLTTDGGCILAGLTWSDDGNVTFHYPGSVADGWVVKVDAMGQLQWEKTLGGTGWDLLHGVVQTEDGGYVVVGSTESDDGDVSGNRGGADGWAVKLDTDGNLVWQRTLGGTGSDHINSVVATTDGGFVLAGATNSNDGDVAYNIGGFDGWVVKLDSLGNIQWDLPMGGSSVDNINQICQSDDGGFLVVGNSSSNDGHASGNHGMQDVWVVKLGPEATGIFKQPAAVPIAVFPNPARDVVHLQYALKQVGPVQLEVFNSAGNLMFPPMEHWALPGLQSMEFNSSALPPGVYQLRLLTGDGTVTRSLVKMR